MNAQSAVAEPSCFGVTGYVVLFPRVVVGSENAVTLCLRARAHRFKRDEVA